MWDDRDPTVHYCSACRVANIFDGMSPAIFSLLGCIVLLLVDQTTSQANPGWTNWTSWGACSRTCESGVRSRQRSCQSRSQPCAGNSREHQSCNTEPCPDDGVDFRAHQCATHNSQPMRGHLYEWVPYLLTQRSEKCALFCQAKGFSFYARLADKVIDGTRFSDDSFDICVDGQRMPAGCDGVLYSNAKLDQCGVCKGTNSTCDRYCGMVTKSTFDYGYSRILTIPPKAENIYIEEVVTSNNYLSIKRNSNSQFLLNGNYKIVLPDTYDIVGASCTYRRDTFTPEKITCTGQLTEAIDIMLLYQTANWGIRYCYSVPKNANETVFLYSWYVSPTLTSCTATCGGGYRHRPVSCLNAIAGNPVHHSLCNAATKPSSQRQPCGTLFCPPSWKIGNWSSCSAQCGYGSRTRSAQCVQKTTRTFTNPVADIMCTVSGSPKPSTQNRCYAGRPCISEWTTGDWSSCSLPCGRGTQSRAVICDSNCTLSAKPASTKQCNLGKCRWRTKPWSPCSSDCGYGVARRTPYCRLPNGSSTRDQFCRGKKPVIQRECYSGRCVVAWSPEPWSECSASCGPGNQTRRVRCPVSRKNGVHTECDQASIPSEMRDCEVSPCPTPQNVLPDDNYEWFASPWSECSVTCDVGVQVRAVSCVRTGGAIVHDRHCSAETKPPVNKECQIVASCQIQWISGAWSECSVTCGQGFRHRPVVCLYKGADEYDSTVVLPDNDCSGLKPATRANCSRSPCTNTWHSQCATNCVPVKQVRSVCASDTLGSILQNEECDSLPGSLEVCSPQHCRSSNTIRAVAHYYNELPPSTEKSRERIPPTENKKEPTAPSKMRTPSPLPTRKPMERQTEKPTEKQRESTPSPCKTKDQPWCLQHLDYCNNEAFQMKYCCQACRKTAGRR